MFPGEIKRVDIAICTWNRADQLTQTLESVAQLMVPADTRLTVLVVDNRSTDETPILIEDFQNSSFANIHSVQSLFEPQSGHTFCRNRAIEAAKSDLMIWTDDDVIVSKDWLARYVAAANTQPGISFWGSVIDPKFHSDRPPWIHQNWDILKGCFAHRDLGPVAVELNESRLPYGANFAIRTEIQKAFRFDSQLGRRGHQVFGEDELDLFRRLMAEGHRGQWVPDAAVQHVIPAERSTERYVFDYFVGQGQALVAQGTPWHKNGKQLLRESASEYAKYKVKRLFSASPVWVSHLVRSALAKGQAGALRESET